MTSVAAAIVVAAATVISATAARGERTVKAANYAVCSAGKALGETAYDTVATATVVVIACAADVVAATATVVVIACAADVVAATTAVVVCVIVSDGTSAAAYASVTV